MPVSIHDLAIGDRVILNCPKARVMQKREGEFEGIFRSVADAVAKDGPRIAACISAPSAEFLASGEAWARFLMGRIGAVDIIAAFVVEPDGGLREEEGRRVFIERKLGRALQG